MSVTVNKSYAATIFGHQLDGSLHQVTPSTLQAYLPFFEDLVAKAKKILTSPPKPQTYHSNQTEGPSPQKIER